MRPSTVYQVVARGHYFDIADQQTQKLVEFLVLGKLLMRML